MHVNHENREDKTPRHGHGPLFAFSPPRASALKHLHDARPLAVILWPLCTYIRNKQDMALPHAHGKFAKETKLQTPFHALATPANDIRKQTVVVHILHSPYRPSRPPLFISRCSAGPSPGTEPLTLGIL